MKPIDQQASWSLTVRLTEAELKAVQRAALDDERSASAWVRLLVTKQLLATKRKR